MKELMEKDPWHRKLLEKDLNNETLGRVGGALCPALVCKERWWNNVRLVFIWVGVRSWNHQRTESWNRENLLKVVST